MASGPYPDKRRGTWSIQWNDGYRWRRTVVVKRRPGWRPKDGMPAKPPPEAVRALVEYQRKETEAKRGRGADPDRTIADFLASYATAYALDHPPSSRIELDKAIGSFLDWCKGAKVTKLDRVTPTTCRRWIEARAGMTSNKTGGPIQHATLAKERALLSGAWSRAVKHEEIDRNPWQHVEIPARPERKPKGSWTPEQAEKLLAACRPWLRDILTVGLHAGLRISALLALEWRDVRWAKVTEEGFGEIVVRPETDKAGKGYRVPIHKKAHDVLAPRFGTGHEDHDRVLTGEKGKPARLNVTAAAIIRACKRAGLPKPQSPTHHMRRSFGRWAVLGHLTGRPIPIYVVSKWMGHASVSMTEKYLELDRESSGGWMADQREGSGPGSGSDAGRERPIE